MEECVRCEGDQISKQENWVEWESSTHHNHEEHMSTMIQSVGYARFCIDSKRSLASKRMWV